jgi:hypothetical protein
MTWNKQEKRASPAAIDFSHFLELCIKNSKLLKHGIKKIREGLLVKLNAFVFRDQDVGAPSP